MSARSSRRRFAYCVLTFVIGAGAGAMADAAEESSSADDHAACSPTVPTPSLRTASPSEYPESLWDGGESWSTKVSFRLDQSGQPYLIRVALTGFGAHASSTELVRSTEAAFARYRFCLPVEFSAKTDWTASMRFVHVALKGKRQGEELYVQIFVPSYTAADRAAKRSGTTMVRGLFDADGRPISVSVLESSGDDVLDAKSRESMIAWQLTYRHGETMKFPVGFEQPYHYEIH